MELGKRETENAQQYLWRIGNLKDAGVIAESWDQLTPILNESTSYEKCADSWRKEFGIAKRYYENVFKTESSDVMKAEVLKRQAQTKNIETNKWLREYARDEMILEEIKECVSNMTPLPPPEPSVALKQDRVGVLCFGDEHFGTQFKIYGLNGEVINEYNEKIFVDRMMKMYSKTLAIVMENRLTDLYVFTFGDFADGILRTSQLLKLQYGIVESTVKYAEYLATWLNALTSVVRVHFQTTPGNHTELRMIGQPKGTFKNENMDIIVRAYLKARLSENKNFEMKENPTNYIYEDIFGYKFLGVHGEVNGTSNVIKDFATAYNTKINYFMAGHKHHRMADEAGCDVEFIGIPSVIGVDPYAMSLNVTSNPAATLLLVEEGSGLVAQHFIKLA